MEGLKYTEEGAGWINLLCHSHAAKEVGSKNRARQGEEWKGLHVPTFFPTPNFSACSSLLLSVHSRVKLGPRQDAESAA